MSERSETVFLIRLGRSRLSLTRDEVKGLLQMEGLTCKDMAIRLGASPENLSRLLNGRGDFPNLERKLVGELERIAPRRIRAAS
jgi:hypothetical protein